MRFDWLTSVAFWVCLVFAGGLYAAAALAPKLLTCLQLTQQHHSNQLRLVALEQDDQRVQKITAALRDDPRYAQELARQEFPGGTDDQRIPVEGSLAIDSRPSVPHLNVPEPELPWYAPAVALVARDRAITTSLLIVATVLVLYAFAFLPPGR